MPSRFKDEDGVVIRFGAGINSRASEDQIDELECAAGQNFLLDPGNGEFRPRKPFDLIGTVPNASEIRGFATLEKADGSVSMLVQAGTDVYEWDGATTFTSRGTVASGAKIRGTIDSNFVLDDKVIITDLALVEDVLEWDGTTLQNTTFLQSDGSTAFGNFRAKYCVVDNERALFGNIFDNSQTFPHLIVGSERGQFEVIDTGNRPSSSLSEEDPFFLPMPQLRPINGMSLALNIVAISQQKGAWEYLAGDTSKDYNLQKLHRGSGASGFESVVSIINDIVYGRVGAIESLKATEKFGNVEYDDISFKIAPDTGTGRPSVRNYTGWTLVYNPRVRRVYCFPDNKSECWVLFTDFIGTDLSPWSKWVTDHPIAFQPSAVMMCLDPSDGLEYVFFGDDSGNLYRMEGSGSDGDGGSFAVDAWRDSKMYDAPLDSKVEKMNGWNTLRRNLAVDTEVTVKWSGEHVESKSVERTFSAAEASAYYGGTGILWRKQLLRTSVGTTAHTAMDRPRAFEQIPDQHPRRQRQRLRVVGNRRALRNRVLICLSASPGSEPWATPICRFCGRRTDRVRLKT